MQTVTLIAAAAREMYKGRCDRIARTAALTATSTAAPQSGSTSTHAFAIAEEIRPAPSKSRAQALIPSRHADGGESSSSSSETDDALAVTGPVLAMFGTAGAGTLTGTTTGVAAEVGFVRRLFFRPASGTAGSRTTSLRHLGQRADIPMNSTATSWRWPHSAHSATASSGRVSLVADSLTAVGSADAGSSVSDSAR